MSNVNDVEQLTKEQAINYDASKLSDIDKFIFQVRQTRLCMDFSEFHRVTEVALGRGVWTHEFANAQRLWDEYNGKDVGNTDPFSTLISVLS